MPAPRTETADATEHATTEHATTTTRGVNKQRATTANRQQETRKYVGWHNEEYRKGKQRSDIEHTLMSRPPAMEYAREEPTQHKMNDGTRKNRKRAEPTNNVQRQENTTGDTRA